MLGTTSDELMKALCYRVVGNKHGTVDKMHTADQAEYGRNAFTKVRGGEEFGFAGIADPFPMRGKRQCVIYYIHFYIMPENAVVFNEYYY